MSKKIVIGQIKSAHGLKDQFKILTFTSEPKNIFRYGSVSIGDQYKNVVLKEHKALNNGYIVSCSEIESRSQVEEVLKENILISHNQLPDISNKNFYYYHDLIDLSVMDESEKIIGTIISVSNYGSDDVIEIQLSKKKDTFLMPFNKNFITSVDTKNKNLYVKNIQDYIE